jgi:HD superfamily phosphohydrolase
MANKILNDPIYGLIDIPAGIVSDLIEHPYFQRLRRINQLGLTHYVYPAATHTRFSHCVGAMHLTCEAVKILQSKGVPISEEEAEAVIIAILLHDLGHGPFSHSLEHHLLSVHHEELSLALMEDLNEAFDGKLSLAIQIFQNKYHKKFLHQLVSGQLDMDRLDYLSRDSFFTGVIDGKVSHDRLLKTLNVFEDSLVLEFKGIYSVENFLNARRLMYWQVYLHKNVICASEMMIQAIKRARHLIAQGITLDLPESLLFFLQQTITTKELKENTKDILYHFQNLDDADIIYSLKKLSQHPDFILAFLAQNLINRRLFKIEMQNSPWKSDLLNNVRTKVKQQYNQLSEDEINYLILTGKEANRAYKKGKTAIRIQLKNNTVHPISKWEEHNIQEKEVIKYFICYPK